MALRVSRRASAWALAFFATTAGLALTALPARAQTDEELAAMAAEATAEVKSTVSEHIASTRRDLATAQRAVDGLEAQRDAAKDTLDDLQRQADAQQAHVSEMDRQLQTKDEAVNETRRRLAKAATELWMAHSGEMVNESPSDQYMSSVRRDRYGRATGEVPRELISQYKQQRSELEVLRNRADDERAKTELERRAQERVVADMDALVSVAQSQLRLAETKAQRWQALETAPATPLMSASLLTPAEMAGWFTSTGRTARLGTDDKGGPMDIQKLATYFIEEGQRYGIRGDIAFAQAIHETGYFSFPDYGQVRPEDNNFAGIGACNSCSRGYQYPNARVGARAQMQLLRNYSDATVTAESLPGGDQPLFKNFDRFGLKGFATYWTDLNGHWAVPGTTYGQAIHRTYLMIYAWAVDHMTVLPPAPAKPAASTTTTTTTAPSGSMVLNRPATPVGQ